MIGGCCGTTPDTIAAMVKALGSERLTPGPFPVRGERWSTERLFPLSAHGRSGAGAREGS